MSEPNLESSIFVHLTDASAGLVFYEPLSDWSTCRPERVERKFIRTPQECAALGRLMRDARDSGAELKQQ